MEPMRKVFSFFKEARAELAKVVWPTRRRTLKLTAVVVVVTVLFGVFISIVDGGLGQGIEYVITNSQKKPTKSVKQQPSSSASGAPVQVPAGGTVPAPANQPGK